LKNFRAGYNDNAELRRTWGGGQIGIKAEHRQEAKAKAIELENLKKAGL
jgi:hypothetical protein